MNERIESIILASASPRRRELLAQIGIRFDVVPAHIDETVACGEAPGPYVVRMAREKAWSVYQKMEPGQVVLGADTSVILDQAILGKPGDAAEAAAMLGELSGREHEVYSAVAVVSADGQIEDALNVTRVTFDVLDDHWIEKYCATGDPMDKAGSYGVQGRAGEKISHIEGSFYGVMGLPLFETSQLLRRAEVLFF